MMPAFPPAAMFAHPWRWASALLGMALFWAAEISAAWVGLAAFGLRMNATALIIGFATGMLFTRRIGPLGGAGLLALVLPLTIWSSGAPLAVAGGVGHVGPVRRGSVRG